MFLGGLCLWNPGALKARGEWERQAIVDGPTMPFGATQEVEYLLHNLGSSGTGLRGKYIPVTCLMYALQVSAAVTTICMLGYCC